MVITINLTGAEWDVLKPILRDKIIGDDSSTRKIDRDAILNLDCGVRILNILRDGNWYNAITGSRTDDIEYVGQLKAIDKDTFCRHRNAGRKTWLSLKAYIETLK